MPIITVVTWLTAKGANFKIENCSRQCIGPVSSNTKRNVDAERYLVLLRVPIKEGKGSFNDNERVLGRKWDVSLHLRAGNCRTGMKDFPELTFSSTDTSIRLVESVQSK